MKRLVGLILAAGVLGTLGGCVYPAYERPGVVYDDGAVVGRGSSYYDDDYGYGYGYARAPAYYAGYYDPWYYGYGGPWLGLGFYGSYYSGGHHHGGYYHHGSHNYSHGSHSGSGSNHHGH